MEETSTTCKSRNRAYIWTCNQKERRMRAYPIGSRLLFWLHKKTGVGVQQLYAVWALRFCITLLDKLAGKPPT